MNNKKNDNRIKMPLWYLSKQVSINWSSKAETPDRRPLSESVRGLFAEIFWAILVIIALISVVTIIWLIYLI
jgi:hypothetical protein